MSAIEVIALRKTFHTVVALDSVDLTVKRATVHGIIGPNGSGKSTLINCVSGVLSPDSGTIRLGDDEIVGRRPHEIAKNGIRRTFQHGTLAQDLTVRENVLLGLHNERITDAERHRRVEQVCATVGIEPLLPRRAANLVWAERQRVQIARAIVARPTLLLLDEPTAGLGRSESEQIIEIVRSLRESGTTVLLVSHDVRLLLSSTDRVTVLDGGRVIADDTPEAVRQSTTVREAYLGPT